MQYKKNNYNSKLLINFINFITLNLIKILFHYNKLTILFVLPLESIKLTFYIDSL